MKLAISNIGWTKEEEPAIAKLLQELGVKYVELAPTKQWDDPTQATSSEIDDYKKFWLQHGIEPVAFQSMLFSRPDLKIFESNDNRKQTLIYLKSFIELAAAMGVTRMVFGSPKNRQLMGLTAEKADDIATQFFTELASKANEHRVCFCIEPNAEQYACDYVTNAEQGAELVRKINSPGFGLHLDVGCMVLAEDDIKKSIVDADKLLKHFHISSPMLDLVEDRYDVDHRKAAEALREVGYEGIVSIEMRPGDSGSNVDRVRRAVTFAQSIY